MLTFIMYLLANQDIFADDPDLNFIFLETGEKSNIFPMFCCVFEVKASPNLGSQHTTVWV